MCRIATYFSIERLLIAAQLLLYITSAFKLNSNINGISLHQSLKTNFEQNFVNNYRNKIVIGIITEQNGSLEFR
jgi:hypothetical protein